MDLKRLGLYIALVVIGYFIILQWNDDYYTNKEDQNKIVEAINKTDTKKENKKNNSKTEDIKSGLNFSKPNIKVDDQQKISNLEDTDIAENNIEVKTNEFRLKINLNGGDITEAELLNYKENLKSSKNFKLIDSRQNYYVIQSELQGLKSNRIVYKKEDVEVKKIDENKQLVILKAEDSTYKINKVYEFKNNSYEIKVRYEIENLDQKAITPSFLGLIKRDNAIDPSAKNGARSYSFLGAAYSTDESKYEKIPFEDFGKDKFNTTSQKGWIAILQHYFISAWILDGKQKNQLTTAKDSQGNNVIGFLSTAVSINSNEKGILEAKLYIGPKIQKELEKTAENLDLSVDFGWLWFISQPLFWILDFIHKFVGNWGIAIMLLTLLIKLAFFNLSAKSYKSMAKMKKLTPQMQKIKEQYPDDRQKQSQAMMSLYSKEKVNPMGGCLPILVQMPVFIALYWMLMESIELRQAPFFLWLQDLSVKDPYFVLPLLMGLTMFIQQFLNPPATDPMQDKIMKLMPVIFTVFFLWFPAGLVLYWLTNNVLSILQQWIITRSIEKEDKKVTN